MGNLFEKVKFKLVGRDSINFPENINFPGLSNIAKDSWRGWGWEIHRKGEALGKS